MTNPVQHIMTRNIFYVLIITIILSCGITTYCAEAADNIHSSKHHDFKLTEIASRLQYPWAIAFLPNDDMLITEREGSLKLLRKGQITPITVTGLPDDIYVSGQGGMLDVILHPNFADNRLIYFSYAAGNSSAAGTAVARAKLNNNRLENLQVIFAVDKQTKGRHHYGSRLVFDNQNHLYITIGDRYSFMDDAQNPSNHLGSIIRLNDDGSIPEDNPFIDVVDHADELFTYGHRNPQGIAFRPSDQSIWAHEHGPRGGDEVNILKAGANYGWPAITYGIDYDGSVISQETHAEGMEQPVIYWTPSIAPSGMTFYDSDQFPEWRGNIFLGALAKTHLRRLVLEGDNVIEQEVLLDGLGRIRDVSVGNDGHLYILTDSLDGKVYRLDPVD